MANDILDTVTSNQPVIVYRNVLSQNDLIQIANYYLTNTQPSNMSNKLVIDGFVKAYECLMKQESIKTFFGMKDFTHFLAYIEKVASETNIISSEIVVQALEINFNGSNYFKEILTAFLNVVRSNKCTITSPSNYNICMVHVLDWHKPKSSSKTFFTRCG